MSKTPLVMKRILDVMLVLLVLGVLIEGVLIFESAPSVRVSVPVHFSPATDATEGGVRRTSSFVFAFAADEGAVDDTLLVIENEVLGTGHIGDASGDATFEVPLASGPAALYILGFALGMAPAFLIVILLRKIAASVVAGEPFAEANIDRIRALGGFVIAFEFLRGAVQFALGMAVITTSTMEEFSLIAWGEWNLGIFVLGVVILALAEVFRHGLELQADVDLTV